MTHCVNCGNEVRLDGGVWYHHLTSTGCESPQVESIGSSLDTLRLHIVSEHANAIGLELDLQSAIDYHQNEHEGPCTIRNHAPNSFHWTPEKVYEVLADSFEGDDDD